jgi:hypothetical protein
LIGFVEFTRCYKTDDNYKLWFSYFENFLDPKSSERPKNFNDNPTLIRLAIFINYLFLFLKFLDPKALAMVPRQFLASNALILSLNDEVRHHIGQDHELYELLS